MLLKLSFQVKIWLRSVCFIDDCWKPILGVAPSLNIVEHFHRNSQLLGCTNGKPFKVVHSRHSSFLFWSFLQQMNVQYKFLMAT